MNILLSRTDRLGDLILSTPAIATMRRSFPHARVTIVCSPYNSVVMERNPDVDAIERLPEGTDPASFGKRFRGADIAVALAPRSVDHRLVGATDAPVRVGYTYARRYLARLFMGRYLTRVAISEADPARCERERGAVRHEVDQVLALAELAGARDICRDLVLPIGDQDRERVRHVPEGAVCVHLAPRWLRDGSTAESLLALLRELRELGRPIVATYGSDSLSLGKAVADARVADVTVGLQPFGAWAATFERCALVVTVDTGATHVASAVGRPTVVLFEHRYFHLNSQEWSPYRVPNAVLRKPPDDSAQSLARSRREIVAAAATFLAVPLRP